MRQDWNIPYPKLTKRLKSKCKSRVLRSDRKLPSEKPILQDALALLEAELTLPRLGWHPTAAPASAETTLLFNRFVPAKHPFNVGMFIPWAKDVERVTNGSVKVMAGI